MPPLVVGISGPTRSGKGTLVKGLIKRLLGEWYWGERVGTGRKRVSAGEGHGIRTVSCVTQDDFFMQAKIHKELDGNYDNPEAIDHEALFRAVQAEIDAPGNTWVFVEGFLAFHDERLFSLLDLRLWLDLSKEVVRSRRMKTKRVNKEYFEGVLWPCHAAYQQRIVERVQTAAGAAGALQWLDATLPKETVLGRAFELVVGAGPPMELPVSRGPPAASSRKRGKKWREEQPRGRGHQWNDSGGAWNAGSEASSPRGRGQNGSDAAHEDEHAEHWRENDGKDWTAKPWSSSGARSRSPHRHGDIFANDRNGSCSWDSEGRSRDWDDEASDGASPTCRRRNWDSRSGGW